MTDDLAWTTLEAEVAYESLEFDVVSERVALPDGTHDRFEFVREPDTVVVVAVTPTGEIVVIEEWREAVQRRSQGLPAGTVEPGDDGSIEATAERELREETGYEADRLEILTTMEPANGIYDGRFHYVIAEGSTPTGSQSLDADESIRTDTCSFEELLAGVLAGEIADGRSGYGILWLAANPDCTMRG